MTNSESKRHENLSAKLAEIQKEIDESKSSHIVAKSRLNGNQRRFRVQPDKATAFNGPDWIQENIKRARAYGRQLEKRYPLHKVYFNRLSKLNWTWIDQMPLDTNRINGLLKLNDQQLNQTFADTLTANSNQLLNENLDDLANSLDSGHAKQVTMIKELINQNQKYYIVLFNTLFPILESETIKRFGNHKQVTWNFSPSLNVVRRITREMRSDQQMRFGRLLELNELNVLMGLYTYFDFNDYSLASMPYSRHTVEHGRFDPNNYTFTQFMQLVLITRNITYSNRKTGS
ncbi:hypothetical protein [Lentilactobacillus diolivorans]|uniref:Uncharacterized protein n=2 Tax=Lentilactobacillus diolivorans TaxID=179838 RepID=A0A0R1SGM7_9LACO|nr:hypothetical protein [Lentilactobacillus diolivorans]KRL68557.1 hypothetical protein FC85_GL002372 [Lentilactobacillus diolivorans DSM 14421]GEP24598.1 hypothetical protein LDI01_21910 [Lentilactobacillus diolivorans]